MRILISGASGFVGRFLVSYFLKKKYEIVPLLHEMTSNGSIGWHAANGATLEDFDAVIHLAGEPISSGRWTKEKRNKILFSRVEGTLTLCQLLIRLRRPPSVFISASAVGYYGDRGEELLDEGSSLGVGFLAHVCSLWEREARITHDQGIRTVQARFGMVLEKNGGVLGKLESIYKMGLGGCLGSGNQWVSWISLADLVLALDHILRAKSLHGPVNLVSPHAVRQKEFSDTLARILHRPALINLPAWFLRLQFGVMANEVLLASARVVPQKLCSSGFQFKYPDLAGALHAIYCSHSENH